MKIRNTSRLCKYGDFGGSSNLTPVVLLDSGHDFENLHWSGYGGWNVRGPSVANSGSALSAGQSDDVVTTQIGSHL